MQTRPPFRYIDAFKIAQEPCSREFQHTASFPFPSQPRQRWIRVSGVDAGVTYEELGEAKVANFDCTVVVDEHIVTFNVSVDNAQVVHVQVDSGAVQGNFHSLRQRQLHIPLHMQHVEQTVVHQLVDDHDVWDCRAASHEEGDVRVSQNALHHDFILDLSQQLVSDVRVENFLDCNRGAIEETLMDD